MDNVIEMNQAAENEKGYTLRPLCSKDVFPMSKIISKIGINEFTKCFQSEEIKGLIASMQGDNTPDDSATIVGISVALDIANVILGNLSSCEQEIYSLLAGLSGMTKKQIETLPMNTFFEMVIDVIKKDEFKGFIQVVSRLFKSEN